MHMKLVCKQQNYHKYLDLVIIFGLLIVKIIVKMFYSYFGRKYENVLTFKIVHFPNFEISAYLLFPPLM